MLFSNSVYADEDKKTLPIPRFVSLKAPETNVRNGPGLRYQIKFVITRKNMPVEILAEFEQWRKIKEVGGEQGWVHQAMLKGRRTAIISSASQQPLRKQPDKAASIILNIEPNVYGEVRKCNKDWCELRIDTVDGWIEKTHLWGVYKDEVF